MVDARRRLAPRSAVLRMAGFALGCAACAATLVPPAGATPAPVPMEGRTWQGLTLDVLPLLATSPNGPELVLAQRSIPRDIGKQTDSVGPEPSYEVVDIEGWKSPAQASAMSLVLPGTGQLYAGSNRGYVFLGVEAVAALAYVKYRDDSHDKESEYFSYVGDPYQAGSRFSFDRLAGTVSPSELARLQEIYAKDQREFYDAVSTDNAYLSGWNDPTIGGEGARSNAQGYIDEVQRYDRKSNVGLYTLIANHLVSAVDALHLTRMNNFALRQNLSLRIKVRPGPHQSYGMTLTQKF